ncbi:MAG: spore germination protein, partial [Clostridia bacterium]|nr:spore germination protein [Clostridia bacterium]
MSQISDAQKPQKIPISAAKFEQVMQAAIGKNFDVVIDRFKTNFEETVLVYVDGLVNKDLVDRDILKPLKSQNFDGNFEKALMVSFDYAEDIPATVQKALEGNVAVFYAKSKSVIIADLKQWDKRAVDTPDSEGVTRGPKEGFTENFLTNISLIRRKLRTPNFTIEKMLLGRQTNTSVAILYLDDIVNRSVLEQVKQKLSKIDTDAILETGHIEAYLEDSPYCIVSGIGLTQKPDVVAARILEGRLAIVVDGTPHVLTIPELFIETLQNAEDYYTRTIYANFLRFIRVFSMFLSIYLPGVSVAILTFDVEMVPFTFLESIIKATQGTPFPIAFELFFLGLMFELLKEAGLRMPKAIGSAITIVGALILGDIAVSAGVAGAPSVIIIAITAVASLLTINVNEFATLYRFFLLFLGSIIGIIGIAAGTILMLTQLFSKTSFGIPIL